jgi:nuclear mRNA export protein PCID2/THP1
MHTIIGKPYLSIALIVTAFKWLDIPIDSDEVECIAANLIYRGIIRGYIAHTKGYLVLSKQNPFPAEKLGNR